MEDMLAKRNPQNESTGPAPPSAAKKAAPKAGDNSKALKFDKSKLPSRHVTEGASRAILRRACRKSRRTLPKTAAPRNGR